jgi:prevent-host-death family protein
MRIDQDIRPLSELGTGAASFLKQVHETRRPLVITQHGQGVGVLLDVGEYEAMQEKIEVLQDIHTAVTQLNEGQGIEHDKVKKRVLNQIAKQ